MIRLKENVESEKKNDTGIIKGSRQGSQNKANRSKSSKVKRSALCY